MPLLIAHFSLLAFHNPHLIPHCSHFILHGYYLFLSNKFALLTFHCPLLVPPTNFLLLFSLFSFSFCTGLSLLFIINYPMFTSHSSLIHTFCFHFSLTIPECLLLIFVSSLFIPHSTDSHSSLLNCHFTLLTVHYSLLIIHSFFFTCHYRLLTSHFSLYSEYFSLFIMHYPRLTYHTALIISHSSFFIILFTA